MNYPIWDLSGRGLLIAGIAILHVFISHFAVGGGLFLVVTERHARRSGDDELLAWVRRHSRFFVLLTLVLGAITGVGIWFTIGLVHPDATATLISAFVWAWAIEWTFFIAEIAAALVYFYGWDRLSPAVHLRVGWIYFWNAWLSLFVINGILTFMLTPGAWLHTGKVLDGFFNPTFWPSLVVRTLGAAALAGIYALLTAAWEPSVLFRRRMVRYAGWMWTVPAIVLLPLSASWWLSAARSAGVPVAELFGAGAERTGALLSSLVASSASGYPPLRAAALSFLVAIAVVFVVIAVLSLRAAWLRPGSASVLMLAGLVAIGGAEWVREGLRKPWVISGVMFTNGVRLPVSSGRGTPPPDTFAHAGASFNAEALLSRGVLSSAHYVASPAPAADDVEAVARDGERVYRALCGTCHTVDGYLAIRPLVKGKSPDTLQALLPKLALPVAADGKTASWSDPGLRLATWRQRQMPPFTGDARDARALALYLATLGGATRESLAAKPAAAGGVTATYYQANCAMCHGDDGEFAFKAMPKRSVAEYEALLTRLPQINDLMPPFEGTDAERAALAAYIAALPRQAQGGAR